MKTILAINGSASRDSSNLRLLRYFAERTSDRLHTIIEEDLKVFPPFDPALSAEDPPASIIALRERIANADGILICTPEYVFSIPSCLKNILEWCVATTLFSGKPTAVITASASGVKGHEELQMILRTVEAGLQDETNLLVHGIRGKINDHGLITDALLKTEIDLLADNFLKRLNI